MSDPARQYLSQEPASHAAGRPVPGPLRDWLAAMKAHQTVPPSAPARAEAPRPEPARPEPARVEPARAAPQNWAPRVVPTPEPILPEAEDISELMAENLMLKAKLRIETERYAELQAILAQEIRDLRRHVQDEMEALHEVREERDALRGERAALREERELWQARAEALAQPLFQKR
ncbi:hypothetical protein [Methylobacterium sp. A54F]